MNKNKKKILVIDDDFDYLTQQRLILEGDGHEVITAENEKQAREMINSDNKFDMAIVDLMMDDMDSGFILSYEIKKKYPEIPVIIVTAVKSQTGFSFDSITENEKKWIKADLILAKPVRPEQILKEIQKIQL